MKIGVSSYSFAQYIRETPDCTYKMVCDHAKEMGFDGIEFVELENFCGVTDPLAAAAEIKAYCAEIGLEICAYTVGANLLADDLEAECAKLRAKVDVAASLGAPTMRHDVCYALRKTPDYSWQDALSEMVPVIREITEYAASKGVRTCTENHGFIFQDPLRVETLIRTVNHPNYGWLVDMGNFLCAEADPTQAVAIGAPYAFHVHAKDFLFKPCTEEKPEGFFGTRGQNWLRGTVISHGVVPVRACVRILKNAGYDGWMSVEFEGMEKCLDAIRTGGNFLRSCAENA